MLMQPCHCVTIFLSFISHAEPLHVNLRDTACLALCLQSPAKDLGQVPKSKPKLYGHSSCLWGDKKKSRYQRAEPTPGAVHALGDIMSSEVVLLIFLVRKFK